jgi:hypothetical protein
MRTYREQLHVPFSWWLLALINVAILATTVWAGFDIYVAVAAYVILGGATAAWLLIWGHLTSIEVTGGELRAAKSVLPLGQVGDVTALDAAQTQALRGPRADPRAFLLVRSFLKESVYVEVTGRADGPPYWLLSTRRPAELAAAIQRSQPATRASDGAVG